MLLNIFFATLNIVLGVLPSFLFFVWMEQNCNLSFFPNLWRDLDFEPSLIFASGFNFFLILTFGAIHSLTAQKPFYLMVAKFLPERFLRSVYMMITGFSVIGLMYAWKLSHVELWRLPLESQFLNLLSLFLFWTFLVYCGFIVKNFGSPLHFIGLKQIFEKDTSKERQEGSPVLCTTGIFGWVRHPVYFLTLLDLLMAPVMSLDRLLLSFGIWVYLLIGIPIEEKKLIAIFGDVYKDYQKKVPALFPKIWR